MSLAMPPSDEFGHRPSRSWASNSVDFPAWCKAAEKLRGDVPRSSFRPGEAFFVAATYSSFRMDGISITQGEVAEAISRRNTHRAFRSRLGQRLRNHAAILLRIERLIGRGALLKADTLLSWYTAVSCGLSTTMPAGEKMKRIETVVRQVNSPHLRLLPALTEMSELHQSLLADELVPSFNGILARLVLHFHLGRCGLLPVIFDPAHDSSALFQQSSVGLRRLMQLIDDAYARR
jgi:hypothetical protein